MKITALATSITAFLVLPTLIFGQSILKLDSARIDQYVNEARSLMVSYPDSCREVALNLYTYSQEQDYAWGMAQGHIFVGTTFHRQGQFDSAVFFFDSALKINEDLKDTLQIGVCKLNKGMCYVSTGQYQLGAENTIESIKLLESILDSHPKARGAYLRCFNILGQVYYYQNDFIKTKEYFLRYLSEAIKAKDTLSIASANNNLGSVYYELGDYDKALEHDLKGAEIHKHLNNPMGYANSIQNIASGLKEIKKYDESLKYFLKALELYREVPNEKGVSEVLFNLGAVYLETDKLTLSEQKYNDAIALCQKIKNKDVEKRATLGLSKVYAQKSNFKRSLEFYKKYHSLSDSLVNLQNLNKVSELEIAYNTEKKVQQIVLLNTEKELQAAVIESNRIGIVALILFIISGFIVVLWVFKRTQYRQRLTLEIEKARFKEEQVKAIINSQEKERKRFAMDLHDDFGQLLSAMRLNVHSIKETVSDSTNDITKKSEELIDNMYNSLKNIAFDLMPHTLFEKGLEEALDELKDQINGLGGLRLEVQSFGIKDKIEGEKKIALYRIIQEFVSNIIKYSDAKKINISITDHDEGLSLIIEDDGLGYDLDAFRNGKGNGWKNVNSRLDMLNGAIEFDTMKGRKNSTISIDIPYHIHAKSQVA